MRGAKILENSEFIIMLRNSLDTQFTHQEQILLDLAYDRFLGRIERVSRGDKSKLEKLRLFTHVGESLERFKLNIRDRTSSRYLYAQSAASILDFEKRAILLQLKYPGLSEGYSTRRTPPFRIAKGYTSTDLMEIITALHAMGFFCLADNTPAPLAQITREFEQICNIRIKSPDNCRWAILNRKTKLTHFIDTLHNILTELSQQ